MKWPLGNNWDNEETKERADPEENPLAINKTKNKLLLQSELLSFLCGLDGLFKHVKAHGEQQFTRETGI